jgi:hypothetical protein
MTYIPIEELEDFLEVARPKFVLDKWSDITRDLQEYHFASRLFNKAGPDDMEGPQVEWRLQIDNNDNFTFTGLYQPDVTSRKNLLTHAHMHWSMNTSNYTYDIKENVFRTSTVEIIKYMQVLEHSLYNSYFDNMERAMFGSGPTSPTQTKPPPASLLWWIQPYNTDTGYGNESATYQLASGVTSDFLGMNPYGYDSVGTAGVDRKAYRGWRNRVGTYSQFSEADAVDTIIECMDKCKFKTAHQYADLAPGDKPRWELLTTYATLKKSRALAQTNNDNLGSSLSKFKDSVVIRGAELVPVWAWSNQDFGCARTDGIVVGVDWSTMHYYSANGLRMRKPPVKQDKDCHDVYWQYMDDSGQLVCYDPARNFAVNSTVDVTEHN